MKRHGPSRRMTRIEMPPIAAIMARIAEMKGEGRRVYSLAQAVPWYSPPSSSLDSLRELMNDPSLHRYSPDPGYPEAREAAVEDIRIRRGIALDPSTQFHLTCGASQAFLSGLLTATSVGDTVAVIEPYYFDHVFAIRFSGLKMISIPMLERDGGWELPLETILEALPGLAAVVLVNPGNPTGAVIPDSIMRILADAAEKTGTTLLIDETYERFVFTDDHWHPWKDRQAPHIMTFGSYSKSLGMPGWRLGYLFGSQEMMEQAIKVQDSVVICPPSPSQFLLRSALCEREWMNRMSGEVRSRRDLCRETLNTGCGNLQWREADGAFFTMAAYTGSMPSAEAAMFMLEEYGLGTIPGSAFGPSGEGHLRISFGCLADSDVEPVMDILGSVVIPT